MLYINVSLKPGWEINSKISHAEISRADKVEGEWKKEENVTQVWTNPSLKILQETFKLLI